MSESPIDLRPWAAYVVGHHAHSMRMLQEAYWDSLKFDPEGPEEQTAAALPEQLDQFDEALYVLGVNCEVEVSVLVELRHAFGVFREGCNCLLDESGEAETPVGMAPNASEWQRIREAVPRLVPAGQPLRCWCDLGVKIGSFEYRLARSPGEDDGCSADPIPLNVDPAPLDEIQRDLTAAAQTFGRETIRSLANEFEASTAWIKEEIQQTWNSLFLFRGNSRRALARLDVELQSLLREQEAPSVLVDVTSERIRFLNAELPLDELSLPIGFLWLLCESYPDPVPKQRVVERLQLGDSYAQLKHLANTLRHKHLRKAVAEYYRNRPTQPHADLCFIKNQRTTGSYVLTLPRGSVLVRGSRPNWILPTEEDGRRG